MRKVKYYILYGTGNKYEPTDYIDCIMWIDDDLTTSEIKELLWEDIRESFGDKGWLGTWEVIE